MCKFFLLFLKDFCIFSSFLEFFISKKSINFVKQMKMGKTNLHPIVENINKIAKDRGLSKIQFATLCEFPESKWNKISNGQQELSLWELSKIASSLQIPVQDIITYPDKFVKLEDGYTGERVSVTFEVSPDKRDMLLRLVTKND